MHSKYVFFPVLIVFTACCMTLGSKREVKKRCTLSTEWPSTLQANKRKQIGLVPVRY